MVDKEMLMAKVDEVGIPVTKMCSRAGIGRANFYNHIKGRGDFTATEINGIRNALRLDDETTCRIFFTQKVN